MSRSKQRIETNYINDDVFVRFYEIGSDGPAASVKMALPTWVILSRKMSDDATRRFRRRMKEKIDRWGVVESVP